MSKGKAESFWIVNEWSPLQQVLVGIGRGMGTAPALENTYDPKSREHVLAGTYPTEASVRIELTEFRTLIASFGVKVLTPPELGLNQVFTRDIGFVIEDKFVKTSMVSDRADEQEALEDLLQGYPEENLLIPPPDVRIEGGDVMPIDNQIWVGYSEDADFAKYTTSRTNARAVEWLAEVFPDWQVKGFQLKKSDTKPRRNALHLDCALGIFGLGHAIMHPQGFKSKIDVAFLREHFNENRCMIVSAEEMYHMNCNLLSINESNVISERNFERVNAQLKAWGYTVHEVTFSETAKMEGLLRCATLPLRRQR